jgi:hypothetical protein
MSATKRGIAAELAPRLARAADTHVCLVGADPTDRDLERRMPELLQNAGEYTRASLKEGVHSLDAAFLPEQRLCLVNLSDRATVDAVLPRLREMFEFVVIDAPSRVGGGVGIARVLPLHLDMLVIASALDAGDLALTRLYVEQLRQMPNARGVEVHVVTNGNPFTSGLSPEQLDRRLRPLPVIARVVRALDPRLDASTQRQLELDAIFQPLITAIVNRRYPNPAHAASALPRSSNTRHVAHDAYQQDIIQ